MLQRARGSMLAGAALLVGLAVLMPGVAHRAPRTPPAGALEQRLAEMRTALDRYRDDHGWYPADPAKDYNSDGRADLLVKQLTWFTRDDGKPSERRDADFCFGPYLHDFPVDPVSGSRALVIDQDQARALSCLRDEVAAGSGLGGWYYESRTGNVVANYGRGSQTRFAQF